MSQYRKSRTQFFLEDGRGNVAIIFGLVLIPVLALMGLAVDGLRALNAAETAHNAVDAAALAAARAMNEQDLDDDALMEVVRDYFDANAEGLGKVRDAVYSNLRLTANRDTNSVTVTVDASVPTTFGKIMQVGELSLSRSSTATYNLNDIELGLMLDVTGSMRGRKIADLKLAASDLVDILIPDGRHADKVRIGLAPYAAAVNAGSYAALVSDGKSRDDCVVERPGAHAYDDVAPAAGGYIGAYPDRGLRRNSHYSCPRSEIVPITSDKDRLRGAIDRFDAGGWTAGHIGAAWAWYLVSPQWATVWPAASRPGGYGEPDRIKAVVLMTDGEFNTSYHNGGRNRTSDSQADRLCEEIKDKGVVVFSIGFDLDQAEAIETLEDCATDSKHFYLAENGEELRRAFRDIAIKLSKLRLSQ